MLAGLWAGSKVEFYVSVLWSVAEKAATLVSFAVVGSVEKSVS